MGYTSPRHTAVRRSLRIALIDEVESYSSGSSPVVSSVDKQQIYYVHDADDIRRRAAPHRTAWPIDRRLSIFADANEVDLHTFGLMQWVSIVHDETF